MPESTSAPHETLTTVQYAIEAELSRDPLGFQPMPRLIGPFPSREAAHAWLDAQRPVYGSWVVAPLRTPEEAAMPHVETDDFGLSPDARVLLREKAFSLSALEASLYTLNLPDDRAAYFWQVRNGGPR